MKAKKRAGPDMSIDMTPMIDMVFLLLGFFMCAATMSKVDFTPEIHLPIAPRAQVPEDLRDRGTVNILPLGQRTGQGEIVTREKPFMIYGRLVDEQGLKKEIDDVRKKVKSLRVYMRIDRDAEFQLVRRGIKACAEAGVFDIVFGTYQSRSAE